jgi:NAD(P)-dependent dehydrogenase (short-subunit alcohol dehydrogenase family)
MKEFRDKVVVVTGAASGIGRALAIRLGREGAALVLWDVDETGVKETEALVDGSPRVMTALVDVADRTAVETFARRAIEEMGHVDAIINNAGVTASATIEEISYEDFDWILGINLHGVIHGVKSFLPHLRTRPEAHIVNISSINAFLPFPGNGPYNISKYAVQGLSETLMQELLGTKVSVTCVHPGGIKTNIARNARHATPADAEHFDRAARTSADEAARIILRAMQRRKRRLFIGIDSKLMQLVKRLLPMTAVAVVGRIGQRERARREASELPSG